MLFKFAKYLNSVHYFSLFNKEKKSVFPITKNLPEHIVNLLEKDTSYISETARQYDLSWQAIHKGYIGTAETYVDLKTLPLQDEYYFIKKYYNPIWSVYVLILRLLSFKNPVKEIKAWYTTKNKTRSNYLKKPITHNNWLDFKSELVASNPKVSIVIPTLNRYIYLKDVLEDLEKQEYKNFEVLVIDQSEPFNKEFYEDFNLELQLVRQEEKALWLARNTAVKMSKGELLLLFDDDSRVDADWITNHIKCLDFFKAAISSGISISKVGAKVPENYSFFRISDQLDTGNVLIKKEVFKTIGLFDRQFEKQRMGDGEYGLRAYLQGFLNVSNPYAKRLHLKVGTGGLREMGSWDGFRPKKWFGPRPIPSVLYLYRKYYGNKAAKRALCRTVPQSIMPYQYKGNKAMMILGVFVSSLLLPLVLFQVLKSWQLSSKKLQEGSMIDTLR